MPRWGALNFHPCLLPHNRGKHYNFWTLVEETPFGVTLHFVDEGVDSGDIAYKSPIEKTWEDTGATLYAKARAEIVRLFKEKWPEIRRGDMPRTPQDDAHITFHRASELEGASEVRLDGQYRARDLLNLIRARTFPPHPGAWFVENGVRYDMRIEITRSIPGLPDEGSEGNA